MAVFPDTKSALELLRGMRSRMERRTNITNFDSDSKARVLLDNNVEEALSGRNEVQGAFRSIQLSQARYEALDRIGLSHGVRRLVRTFASADASEQSIAFFVASGNFGGINGGLGFTIDRGTTIFSEPDGNELGSTIEFKLTEDVSVLAGSALAYGSVLAVTSGAGSNCASGVLRNHDFTGYAQSAAGTLLVGNLFPILNGREQEDDERYRYRISKDRDRRSSSNARKTELAALSVPGVLDTRIINGYYGIGTVAVVVLGADFQSSSLLVSNVQARLDEFAGPGLAAVAIPAVQVLFDLEVAVTAARTLTLREKADLERSVRLTLIEFFRSNELGASINFVALAATMKQVGANVLLNTKQTSNTDIFDKIYVRKGYSSVSTSEREEVSQNNYQLEDVEYSAVGDITFRYA